MGLRDKWAAMRSRSHQTSRIESPVDYGNEAVEELTVVDSETVYKVYKRRWAGVVIIMWLNIVSSWRYRAPSLSFAPAPQLPFLDVDTFLMFRQLDCVRTCCRIDEGFLWVILDDPGELAFY